MVEKTHTNNRILMEARKDLLTIGYTVVGESHHEVVDYIKNHPFDLGLGKRVEVIENNITGHKYYKIRMI